MKETVSVVQQGKVEMQEERLPEIPNINQEIIHEHVETQVPKQPEIKSSLNDETNNEAYDYERLSKLDIIHQFLNIDESEPKKYAVNKGQDDLNSILSYLEKNVPIDFSKADRINQDSNSALKTTAQTKEKVNIRPAGLESGIAYFLNDAEPNPSVREKGSRRDFESILSSFLNNQNTDKNPKTDIIQKDDPKDKSLEKDVERESILQFFKNGKASLQNDDLYKDIGRICQLYNKRMASKIASESKNEKEPLDKSQDRQEIQGINN